MPFRLLHSKGIELSISDCATGTHFGIARGCLHNIEAIVQSTFYPGRDLKPLKSN